MHRCTLMQAERIHMKELDVKAASEKRTSMNISLALEDKKFLKVYAIEHDTTVAAVIHEFVEKLRGKDGESNGR